jgi:hemerythrin
MGIYDFKRTGIKIVDDQHQKLVDGFARLEAHATDGHDFAASIDALQFLRDYIKEHFACEDQILAQAQYPSLAEHIEEHKVITGEVEQLWNDLLDGKELGSRVVDRMRWWIIDHINNVDGQFAEFFLATSPPTTVADEKVVVAGESLPSI